MPVSDDYGVRIEEALLAIQQMHADVTKLISLLDTKLNCKPVLTKITDQWKFTLDADMWMPEGMYRIYPVPDVLGRVEGITAVFLNRYTGEPIREPLLLVGQAQFATQTLDELKAALTEGENTWCLWNAYLKWKDTRIMSKVLPVQVPDDVDHSNGKLRWVQVIAVPLYSIGGIGDVMALLQQVRAEKTANVQSPV